MNKCDCARGVTQLGNVKQEARAAAQLCQDSLGDAQEHIIVSYRACSIASISLSISVNIVHSLFVETGLFPTFHQPIKISRKPRAAFGTG